MMNFTGDISDRVFAPRRGGTSGVHSRHHGHPAGSGPLLH